MRLYFDSAYIAKCYVNEPDSSSVRKLGFRAGGLYSSVWSRAELACVFHRHVRERTLTQEEAAELHGVFLKDVRNGVWILLPLSDHLLFQVESRIGGLPPSLYLRAGDAIHLVTAQEAGFSEIWSSDRHLLAATRHFGLTAKSV